jgi:hypothetical protein
MQLTQSAVGPKQGALRGILLAGALCGLIATMYAAYSRVYTDLDLGWLWRGSRLWLGGVDPYSTEATFVLRGFWSETASGFPYPFPVVILLVPLALLPLPVASTIWGVMSVAALAALPFVAVERPQPWMLLAPFLFFPFWAAMEQAQFGPILLGIMLLSLHAYRTGRMRLAGFVLPLLFLKPQIGLTLFLALAAFVALRGMDRRWWEGFALGLVIWWGSSLLFEPTWPIAWLRQLQYYAGEDLNSVVAQTIPGALLLIAGGAVTAVGMRRRDAAILLTGLMLIGMLVLPMRSVYNQTVFLLPIMMLADRRPRAAVAAIVASWSIFPLLFFGINQTSATAMALYAPLAILALATLRDTTAKHAPGAMS